MIIQLRGCPRCLWYHSWHHTLWIISLLMKVSEWVGFVSIFAFAWDYWSHSTEKIIFSPETSLSKSQSNLLYLKNLFTTVFHFYFIFNFFLLGWVSLSNWLFHPVGLVGEGKDFRWYRPKKLCSVVWASVFTLTGDIPIIFDLTTPVPFFSWIKFHIIIFTSFKKLPC